MNKAGQSLVQSHPAWRQCICSNKLSQYLTLGGHVSEEAQRRKIPPNKNHFTNAGTVMVWFYNTTQKLYTQRNGFLGFSLST